jgi:hypothetical protein
VQLPKDKLNYKPRTSVKDLAELERLLRDQVQPHMIAPW